MTYNKGIPLLAVFVLLCVLTAGLIFSVRELHAAVIESSIMRVFPEHGADLDRIASAVKAVDGVAAVTVFDAEQAAAEFEAALGHPWPEAEPMPHYLDVSIEPQSGASAAEAVQELAGVEYVAYHGETAAQLAGFSAALQRIYGLMVLVFSVAAAIAGIHGVRLFRRRGNQCAA